MKQPEIDKTYREYKRSVNMTAGQLYRWSQKECSKKASQGRGPINRNLRLLSKKKTDWTARDAKDAKKTISFIARMRKVPAGNPVKGCGISKRTISLKNWAYDPNK